MSIAVVERSPVRDLERLAQVANSEHQAMLGSLHSAILHAINCGEALIEARSLVPIGMWEKWARDNIRFVPDHAAQYMRLAHYKDQLPAEIISPWPSVQGNVQQPSVSRALKYLRGLPPIRDPVAGRRVDPAVRAEARHLRKQGLSYAAIGRMLGYSTTGAHRLVDPAADAKYKRLRQLGRERRRQAARALARQEEDRRRRAAAKTVGGELSKTYELIRKALDSATKAIEKAEGEEWRQLDHAIRKLHQSEDAVGRALKEAAIRMGAA